jgi:hypothetical protein
LGDALGEPKPDKLIEADLGENRLADPFPTPAAETASETADTAAE